ncbi:MAG: hypothetical protein J5I53_09005 [Bradyrhizobiaceae bacterium]|nr:hypothetical protein [Bradyrhizobiaceae bacterium]
MSLLQDLRHQVGVTQQQVASAAKVDVRTVKRWEGEDDPPDRVVRLYQSLFADQEDSVMSSETQPMPLERVMTIVPDPLPLNGILAPLLGSLPRDEQFTILLGGASGAGKSTAALILAGDLADHGAVLVATSEERLRSGTIGLRAKHAGIDPDSIDVCEVMCIADLESLLDEGEHRFVIVDSITEVGLTPDEASRLLEAYPDVAFILVAQADATEKRTVGGARWRHLVDVRLWCERNDQGQRVIRNLKNRFGPQVDQVVLSKGNGPVQSTRTATKARTTKIKTQSQDGDMDDTAKWLVGRLESELAESRQEIRDLRSQIATKDEQLREAAIRIARFEALEDTSEEANPKGFGDSLDVDKLATLADRFAPLIGMVTSAFLNRGSHQQQAPVEMPSPWAVSSEPAPSPFYAQTGMVSQQPQPAPQFDTFIPGISQ